MRIKMGTNYYSDKILCEHCGATEDLHIGKSSGGNPFYLHGTRELNTWVKWKEYLKECNITDEYGKRIAYEDFVNLVEDKSDIEPSSLLDEKYFTKDPQGYWFTFGEFC